MSTVTPDVAAFRLLGIDPAALQGSVAFSPSAAVVRFLASSPVVGGADMWVKVAVEDPGWSKPQTAVSVLPINVLLLTGAGVVRLQAVNPGTVPPSSNCVVAVGTFAKSTASAPAVQSISTPRPAAVIIWSEGGLVSGTWRGSNLTTFGFAANGKQACQSNSSLDAAPASQCARSVSNTRVLVFLDPNTAAILAQASIVLTETGFTLTWDVNNSDAYLIHYMVLGGAIEADLVHFNTPSAPGTQVVTGAAFQPQALMMIGGFATTYDTPVVASATMCVGAAGPPGTAQWVTTTAIARPFDPTINESGFIVGSSVYLILDGGGGNHGQANLTSFDPTGFTLSWVFVGVARPTAALCLRGCAIEVGSPAMGASPQDIATASRPAGVFLATHMSGSVPAHVHAKASYGASDGLTHAASARQDQDNVGTSNVDAVDRNDVALIPSADFSNPPSSVFTTVVSMQAAAFRLTSTPSSPGVRIGYLAVLAG